MVRTRTSMVLTVWSYNVTIILKSITLTDCTWIRIMSNYVQCNICQKWYLNQRGLLIHLGYCRDRHNARKQNDASHHFVDHNPLKSCYDQGEHLNPFAVSFGCGAPIFKAWSIIFDFFIKISPEASVLGPSGGHRSIERWKLHKIDMGAINRWGIILRAKCFTISGSLIML